MFDFLGTFTPEQFQLFTKFVESIDGGLQAVPERLKHLGAEKARVTTFEQYMTAIEARKMAGTLSRWKEEPTFPGQNFLSRGAKADQEPGLFLTAMKFVWKPLFWFKKDDATYALFKVKDRGWQFEEEMRDVAETKAKWPSWKSKVMEMIGVRDESHFGDKRYRCLTHKNDDPATY